jgi:asparagine synthase (glutamine-hydrolysing)
MDAKLDNEIKMMKAVNSVASEFGVRIVQPLLSPKFIEFAKTIPLSEKIHDSEDLYRKHIIRKLASEVGVPEVSYNKRKKALQYGSKIHKALLKTR